MKLNKPPVTEEQTALEEYVDFLLTDLSNVTSIHRNKVNSELNKECTIEDKYDSVENAVPSVLTAVETTQLKNIEKTKQDTKRTKHDLGDLKAAKNDKEKTLTTLESKKNGTASNHEDRKQEKIETSNNDETKRDFIIESEEAELKKWDAILTKEKEQEIIAKEKNEEKLRAELQRQQTDTDMLPKSAEQNRRRVEPIKTNLAAKLEHHRPAIFDDVLPTKEPDKRLLKVEKLLSRISLATKPVSDKITDSVVEDTVSKESKVVAEIDTDISTEISSESAQATFLQREITKTKDLLPEVFQTLIFNVAKLPLAVPLLKLGGIVPINEKIDVTPLVGTPDWFLGLMPHNKGTLMVVDTQKYLMPEQKKENDKEYRYLILLDNSNWALACHDVGDAKNLTQDDIRWSEKSSKRPWFGGMVVDYMSALIEVDQLINMLANNISE
jgi:purine-binding chemotaxis protein CheW